MTTGAETTAKPMAICSKCKQRKAKRRCPALRDDLCNLCCGTLREKKVYCPPSCPFLAKHKPYQEKKIIQKKQAFSEDVVKDERLRWLILHIEAPLRDIAERRTSFTDKESILALEYAREKIGKEGKRIFLPGDGHENRNEVGEAILQSIENCHYQKSIILPAALETYNQEEKLKCLENVILSVKYLARASLEGRDYLKNLIVRFDKMKELSRQKRILSPGS